MCKKPRGFILVPGLTSGKSTTLASMVDKINIDRHEHILTTEDPIEFLYNHKNCVVNQREVNFDTHGFSASAFKIFSQARLFLNGLFCFPIQLDRLSITGEN